MNVKIVADSTSSLTPQLAQRFGIAVVPIWVNFGTETYRDNVDLSPEEFYQKLKEVKSLPTTSSPGPEVFAEFFAKLSREANEIVAITVSRKLSVIYEMALQGKAMIKENCHIEVIDSKSGVGGQMLLAIFAAQMAKAGAKLDKITQWVRNAIPKVHVRVTFDTLEYLRRGGRIGKAQAFLGRLLKVNPVLGIKDGAAFPFARPRNRAKAMDYLVNFAKSFRHIKALAIQDALAPDEAEMLAERLKNVVPPKCIYRSKLSPVVGVHVGPHALGISVLEGEQ